MPYQSMEEVNPALKGIDPPITLAQANMIAGWADRIEEKGGAESPWAAAIALFKRTHHVEAGGWVKNKGSEAEHSDDDDAVIEALLKALEDAGFELVTSLDLIGDEKGLAGEAAYVIDLFTELPQVDGKPDFSQPFRILPCGDIHRYGRRTVTVDDINQFHDNWRNRTRRGIRRDRVVIDIEHEPGGVGFYADIFSRQDDGLWAKINLTPRGKKVLAERDFWFFSPTVAWESTDRVTGQPVHNQIVGGALTNFPVFGDATSLPTLGYSEAALARLWQGGHQIAGYASKTDAGVEYPASAYLIVEDPDKPTTWHLRVKEFVNGKLQVTANMCGRAAAALGPKGYRGNKYEGPGKDEAKSRLRSLYLNTLKVPKDDIPQFSQKGDNDMTAEFTIEDRSLLQQIADKFGSLTTRKGGDDTMPDKDKDKGPVQVTAEQFAELQGKLTALTTQVETLSQERDQLKAQVTDSQQKLATESYARVLQQMREHVQTFSHLALPVKLADDAPKGSLTAQEHFAWLKAADATEGQQHWAFFNEVFRAANAALAEAAEFGEIGSGAGLELSEDDQLHRKVYEYSSKHKVDYLTALKAVAGGAA